ICWHTSLRGVLSNRSFPFTQEKYRDGSTLVFIGWPSFPTFETISPGTIRIAARFSYCNCTLPEFNTTRCISPLAKILNSVPNTLTCIPPGVRTMKGRSSTVWTTENTASPRILACRLRDHHGSLNRREEFEFNTTRELSGSIICFCSPYPVAYVR